MPRTSRLVIPGIPHHVTQRGVRSMPIFTSRFDRMRYLAILRKQCRRRDIAVHAYCLMGNHTHLIVTPSSESSLAKAIGESHRRYAWCMNRRQGAKGHFFEARFFSCPMDRRYFVTAVRYIERNPVRAGLVADAYRYEWSSAAFHVGLSDRNPMISAPFEIEPNQWKLDLRIEPDNELSRLRRSFGSGIPLGDEEFLAEIEKEYGPVTPRKKGRPRRRINRNCPQLFFTG